MFTNSKTLHPPLNQNDIAYDIFEYNSEIIFTVFNETNQIDNIIKTFDEDSNLNYMIVFSSRYMEVRKYNLHSYYKNRFDVLVINVKIDEITRNEINESNDLQIKLIFNEYFNHISNEKYKFIEFALYT